MGAGRPAHRAQAETLKRLDVRDWQRRGLLRAGHSFVWGWWCDGEATGSIGVCVTDPHLLHLRYAMGAHGQQRDMNQPIALSRTACGFGGVRPWFNCPSCGRRCAMLYLRWERFACRTCQRVAFASQSDDALGALMRKEQRLAARLGDCGARPKGMRLRTYERLMQRLINVQAARELAFADLVGRTLRKIEQI